MHGHHNITCLILINFPCSLSSHQSRPSLIFLVKKQYLDCDPIGPCGKEQQDCKEFRSIGTQLYCRSLGAPAVILQLLHDGLQLPSIPLFCDTYSKQPNMYIEGSIVWPIRSLVRLTGKLLRSRNHIRLSCTQSVTSPITTPHTSQHTFVRINRDPCISRLIRARE
jgi:hypothetical protein